MKIVKLEMHFATFIVAGPQWSIKGGGEVHSKNRLKLSLSFGEQLFDFG